jgi:hypothetical protein
MPAQSVTDLLAALADRAFDQLLGTRECAWVDFKVQPYLLTTERGSWELCKDVAGFANAAGGCIVIGVATDRPNGADKEVASELRPVPLSMVNRDQYRDKIVAGVFPVPDGLEVEVYTATATHTYVVVTVPGQGDESKPYLVRYLVDNDGKRIPGFGWPVRTDDAIVWQSCEQFQSRLSLGGLLRMALERTSRGATLKAIDLSQRATERLSSVHEQLDGDAPWLGIQLIPHEPVELTSSMFGELGIAGDFRRRKPLRHGGFDLVPHPTSDVRGPHGVEVGSRWRVAIDGDGIVTLVVPVDENSLAWAMDKRNQPTTINAIVLVEIIHDFFRMFYETVVPRSASSHSTWTGHLRAANMKTGSILIAHGWPRYTHTDELERAASDHYEKTFELTGSPDSDTFTALAMFYALFGCGAESIPFTADKAFSTSDFLANVKR